METPFYSVVTQKLGREVFNDATVLEVGCARFAESIAIRDMVADVTAIDVCKRQEPPVKVNFVLADFLDWRPTKMFKILYMSNSALFMPSENLFKKIESLQPQTIAVRTMYDYPSPNWDASELKTLYFTKPIDWTTYFERLGYKTIHAKSYKMDTPDMRGRMRSFRFTEYIGTLSQ